MAKIKVGLGTVFGDIDLAVLIRAHGARVHIDVRIKLLGGHLKSAGLQKTSQRCCGDSLSKA